MESNHPLLEPYTPTDSDPWDATKAAHLLNRAGFGGTPAEIQKAQDLGPQGAVDWLLDFPDAPATEQMDSGPDLSSIAGFPQSARDYVRMFAGKDSDERKELQQKFQAANREALQATMAWWLNRMATGPSPLQEKLTLFWHGHFTTSARDERSAMLMWKQNELLRRYAAGSFEPFLRAISRDPAMLDYLNNNENRKAHPNENYAREVMELFTLGIGNYTEDDVKQGARAFTGWAHDGEKFVYHRNQHDNGEKTFLGHTGNFDGDDILSIILKQPACPNFIAGELFKYFAYDNADEKLAKAMGETLYGNEYWIRPTVRTILTSKAFYGPQSVGAQIKSPIQLVIGTIRMLDLPMPTQPALAGALNQMGQVPLMPPNVRGWPGGHMWINTSTLFIRYNTGVYLAGGAVPALNRLGRKNNAGKPLPQSATPTIDFHPAIEGTSAEVVEAWVARLIQRPLDPDKKKVLIDALGHHANNPDSQRRLVQLIVSMPEYQLC
jgi:uncharacterized protein (DUF1800 family)